MRYGNIEDQRKKAANTISLYREAGDMLPAIRNTLNRYDGKVFNKRFTEALSRATGKRVIADKRSNWIDFYYYENYGKVITILRMHTKDMKDGKRICAKLALEDAVERRTWYLQRASKIEQAAVDAPRLKAQIEQIEDMLNTIVSGIPSEAQDIFGLYARVTTR